jgi:hypothetical protein
LSKAVVFPGVKGPGFDNLKRKKSPSAKKSNTKKPHIFFSRKIHNSVIKNKISQFAGENSECRIKQKMYSAARGIPGVVREPAGACLASIPRGKRIGKCRNQDNAEGTITEIGGMKGQRQWALTETGIKDQ